MKITFPHLGNVYIATKILFDYLGIDYVIPPLNNTESLKIGSLLSPDEICLPFKYMIGNFVQSINQGADTVLMVGSCGPCRLGQYCELQERIIRRKFKDIKFVLVDVPAEIGIKEFINRLSIITHDSKLNKGQMLTAAYKSFKAMELIDEIDKKTYETSGYEINKGEAKNLFYECKKNVVKENNPEKAIKILQEYRNKINNIIIDKNKEVLKVAIIGEIYTNIEPCCNIHIEDKLYELGISMKRVLRPSWWVKYTLPKPLGLQSKMLIETAKDYLPLNVGGYARETIGEAILANNNAFDGAIQIFPVGCMPEIVAKSILPKVADDYDFPIMTLIVDEMTGEAGYNTRIEAFVDMLERRKEHVLFRN